MKVHANGTDRKTGDVITASRVILLTYKGRNFSVNLQVAVLPKLACARKTIALKKESG